jgi:hypothetical protein
MRSTGVRLKSSMIWLSNLVKIYRLKWLRSMVKVYRLKSSMIWLSHLVKVYRLKWLRSTLSEQCMSLQVILLLSTFCCFSPGCWLGQLVAVLLCGNRCWMNL